ncbi:MAG TPA: DUF2378 family protein, partial [Myxococcaceae bacterium]|nr:DUF2378 family protein [Myxococcaceae bacterium]
VFPGVEQTRAFYLLGERFMEGFFSTVVGRGMALLAKALGPRRMLERMDSNLRAGNNFMQSTVTEVRGTKFKLWLNEVNRHPHFIQGFLEHGLKYAGARDLLIEQSRYDGTSCTYLISWDES